MFVLCVILSFRFVVPFAIASDVSCEIQANRLPTAWRPGGQWCPDDKRESPQIMEVIEAPRAIEHVFEARGCACGNEFRCA